MAFISKRLLILSACLIGMAHGQTPSFAVPMSTKQATSVLRFLSEDGKITYFQNRSGELMLSKNFKITKFMKKLPNTQYTVVADEFQKRMIITLDETYFDQVSVLKPKQLYQLTYGEATPVFLGSGLAPKLHLKNTWASWYAPTLNKLFFSSLVNKDTVSLSLNTKSAPFFQSKTDMLPPEQLLYTDLNNDHKQVLKLQVKSENVTLFEAKSQDQKIEICSMNNILYILTTHFYAQKGTKILARPMANLREHSKDVVIYESPLNDRGQLICDSATSNLYFIKAIPGKNAGDLPAHEAFSFNTKAKVPVPETNLSNTTNLFRMGTRILSESGGEYFVVEGKSENKNDQFSLEKRP